MPKPENCPDTNSRVKVQQGPGQDLSVITQGRKQGAFTQQQSQLLL